MLRKSLIVISLVICLISMPAVSSAAWDDWKIYFNGIRIDRLDKANWWMVGLGMISSLACHELCHIASLEMADVGWRLEFDGLNCVVHPTNGSMTNSERLRTAYMGFAGQVGVGLLLASFEKTRDSDFTRGWIGMASLELLSYGPCLDADSRGDFGMIARAGGNAKLAWAGFVLLDVWSASKIDW
ncbi:MAG: hypothetical protein JRI85_10900 [Deltaproteobacteria bacterium]|nr:hypothetical protein [Deltaproteobacteria bacterium]